jgi:hypothetical protein
MLVRPARHRALARVGVHADVPGADDEPTAVFRE